LDEVKVENVVVPSQWGIRGASCCLDLRILLELVVDELMVPSLNDLLEAGHLLRLLVNHDLEVNKLISSDVDILDVIVSTSILDTFDLIEHVVWSDIK